ncbi:hypothetical protein EDD22DRAFT_957630 [Suillus occidentalis]|nr:hypothetical protein EDD22DRAFT_957630 [Suillus occidentalis]
MSSTSVPVSFSSSQSQFLQDNSIDFLDGLSSPKVLGGYMHLKSTHRPPPVSNHLSESQFLHLQEHLNIYKIRCNKLQCGVARLSGECDTIKESFDNIIKVLQLPNDTDPLNFSIGNITARDANENRPNCNSYPKVRFWLCCDYDRWLDDPVAQRTHGNQGTAPYLEDENGCPISLATLKSMHRGCRGVWAELVVKKLAPPTWARLCAMGQKLVHTFMEKEFQLFRLDADGWKLSLLCTTDYPNWRKSHIDNESNWKMDNKKVIKCEVTGSHNDVDGNIDNLEAKPLIISKGKKHARDTDDTKATHKRVKESGSLYGDSDITASSSSSIGIIESPPSHSSMSASATGSFNITASSSSSIGVIESPSHSSATATGSLDGNLSAPSQICKMVLLDETFLPPLPPLPPSLSPPLGVYLPQPIPCMNHSQ